MEMKKLKVVRRRFEGYTGVLGRVRFTDGVSDEYLPRHIRDQMAASMEFTEIDIDGNEQPAGSQYRMIAESKARAPRAEALERQTEGDKLKELTKAVLDSSAAPELHTKEDLDALADKGGIKALREVGNKWGVKHRSIPTLVAMILEAQSAYVAKRNEKLAAKVAAEQATHPVAAVDVDRPVVEEPAVADAEVSATTEAAAAALNEKLAQAAATGDLGAALNTSE